MLAPVGCSGGVQPEEGRRVESFERLKQLVNELDEEVAKAEGGNKAAGTRVRQAMQDIKAAAQDVRQQILELRKDSSSD